MNLDTQRLFNLKKRLEESSEVEKQFETILENCEKQNTKYVDPKFYPQVDFVNEDKSMFENPDWRRIEDQYKSDLFTNISPHAVCQGKLGDCYFISSLIYVSKNINNVKSLFHPKSSLRYGIVLVYFYILGQRLPVIVDTQIAYKTPTSLEPLFSKPRTNDDSCWFVLVEKAFAKACGGYRFIEAGEAHFGCHSLVNYFPRAFQDVKNLVIDQDDETPYPENEINEKIFNRFQELLKEGALIGSSVSIKNFPGKTEEQIEEEYGVITSHSYQILDAREVRNKKFILVQNPWGRFEYKGEYAKNSSKWTEELKKDLNYMQNEDGSFWMTYDEYRFFFRSLSYCIPNEKNWKSQSVCGSIDGYLDGRSPCSESKNIGCIPQWTVTFTKKTTVRLSFYCVGDESYHGIYIVKNNGLRLSSLHPGAIFCRNTSNSNLNGIVFDVDDFSQPYTFFLTRTDPLPSPCYYQIRVESPDQNFKISKLEDFFDSRWKYDTGSGIFSSPEDYWDPFGSRPLTTCKQWYIKFSKELINKTVEIRLRVFKSITKSDIKWIIAKQDQKISFAFKRIVSDHDSIYSASDYEEYQLLLDNSCDDSEANEIQWVFCIFRSNKTTEIDKFRFEILTKEKFGFGIMPEPDLSKDFGYTISGTLTHDKNDGATPYGGGSVQNLKQWLLTFTKPTTLFVKYQHPDPPTAESIYLELQENPGEKMSTFYKGSITYNFDIEADSEFDQIAWEISDVSKPYTFCVSRVESPKASKYQVSLFSKDQFTMTDFEGKEVKKITCSTKNQELVVDFPEIKKIPQPTSFGPKKPIDKTNSTNQASNQTTTQKLSNQNDVKSNAEVNSVKQNSNQNEVKPSIGTDSVKQNSNNNDVKPNADANSVKQNSNQNEVKSNADVNPVKQNSNQNEVKPSIGTDAVKQNSNNNEVKPNADANSVKQNSNQNEVKPSNDDKVLISVPKPEQQNASKVKQNQNENNRDEEESKKHSKCCLLI